MNYYIKYLVPKSTDNNGIEFLHIWLQKHYPGVTFTPVISDGIAEFGIISGTGDNVSKVLSSIIGKFSVTQMDETTFIGVIKRNYNPIQTPNMPTPPTFVEYMALYGITVSNELTAYKEAKISLILEKVRRKFPHQNDLITDLARSVILITQYYDTLSPQNKTTVDADIASLKTILSESDCISGFHSLVTLFTTIFPGYAIVRNDINNAVTTAEVDAVTYE